MSDDALKLPIEFPEADRTQLALEEVLKSLDGVTRKILESGAASEANARKILALTNAFAEGKKSATDLRAELVALAGDAPKAASALRKDAADAAKAAAAEATRLAEAAKAAADKVALLDARARTLGNGLERDAGAMSRFSASATNVGAGLGVALGGVTAFAAGSVALIRTIGEASASADLHQRALRALGDTYGEIQRATNGTVTATEAYRAQQTLLNAGVRVSSQELALIARHAREHGDVTKTTAERVQELTEALRAGEAEGLRKYGITVDATASRTHNLRSALQQMTHAAGENAPATRTMGEELTRFNTALDEGASAFGAFVDHATGARGIMASLGDEIRKVSQDILELIENENRLPQQRAAAEANAAAQRRYLEAQRGIGRDLMGLGISQEDVQRLVPQTAIGRLSTEQIDAQARRLALVRSQITQAIAGPTPNAGIFGRADSATDLAGIAAEGQRSVGALGAQDVGAVVAGLRAARRGGNQREVTVAQVRAALAAMTREMADEAEANTQAALAHTRPTTPGQATAPNAPTHATLQPLLVNGPRVEIAVSRFQAERDRRVTDLGRNRAAEVNAGEDLTARELAETPAALARLAMLRDREVREREARLGDLRVSVSQAEEIVSLRQQEERQSRPLFRARQNAILAAQADVAHQQRMIQLAAELSRAQSEQGRNATIDEERLSGRLSRERARTGRAAERADLRDEGVFAERAADAREERALGRERARLQHRLDAQVSFTERMEDLAGRRKTAAEAEAETVTHAFGAMGEAYANHLQAVIAGREDLGTALQGMLSDTLMAISKEASVKAGLYLAEGFASLVMYQYDRATEAFAASALYTAVAVGAGLGGQALAPAKPSTPAAANGASGGGEERGRPLNTGRGGAANDNGRDGVTVIEQHYWSAVVGGRDATPAETGRGMQRYTRAADRRRLGRTGTG